MQGYTTLVLDHIESIQVVDKRLEKDIRYREERKRCFGLFTEEAGFYYENGGYYPYSVEELENGKLFKIKYLVENRKVYYKPHIKVKMVSGQIRCYEFESLGLAAIAETDLMKMIDKPYIVSEKGELYIKEK